MTAMIEYWLTDAKRFWRSVLITGFMQPLFYVLALGVGLGTVIDRSESGVKRRLMRCFASTVLGCVL